MLSLLGSTISDPFTSHSKQALPRSVNRRFRHEKDVMGASSQDEDHDHDAEGSLHPGRDTDRLMDTCNADTGVGPTVDSLRTQSDKKKRKRKEKKKESAVEGPPVKRKKKEKAQS